jgi:hypothetical protein
MTEMHSLAYFLVRYAPNALTEAGADIGVVLFDPCALPNAFCKVRFASDWKAKVLSVDPKADVLLLESLVQDIKLQLDAPRSRWLFLDLMEGSFSNVVRVSDRRPSLTNHADNELERLVEQYL